jgi:cobalt-zinc-cadmium efflux system protein
MRGVSNRLRFAVALTTLVLAGELIVGFIANSLALLSDAGHVFTDVLALSLSWFGVKQAEKPATARMTFGYHRLGILIALLNAGSILAICLVIFYEAYRRLQHPPAVESGLMLGAAFLGLVANMVVVWRLERDQRHNLNVRSAFLHALGDALSSLGVIIAGVVILFTGWFWVDPAISIFIGLVIGFSALRIMREVINVFLEAAPRHLNMEELVQAMHQVPGVKGVHDLHVWSITPQIHALSCHLLIDPSLLSERATIIERLNLMLQGQFNIRHTTVQLDCVNCDPNMLYCDLYVEGEPESQRRKKVVEVKDEGGSAAHL